MTKRGFQRLLIHILYSSVIGKKISQLHSKRQLFYQWSKTQQLSVFQNFRAIERIYRVWRYSCTNQFFWFFFLLSAPRDFKLIYQFQAGGLRGGSLITMYILAWHVRIRKGIVSFLERFKSGCSIAGNVPYHENATALERARRKTGIEREAKWKGPF